jgi:L-histidine Nalpha-methyltransferase
MKVTQLRNDGSENSRFRWITVCAGGELADDGRDVIEGLSQSQKTLPSRYLYDDCGSELFEQITDLPEYYPTRTEQSIIEKYASEITQLTGACELLELGSGSSRKTRILLEAYSQLNSSLYYYPIDVSGGILKATALALLERLAVCDSNQYPHLNLCGIAGTYDRALAKLPPAESENRLLIFLANTLGNLTDGQRHSFLTQIKQALQPGEFFLLGVDLQKPIDTVEAAYNDADGVTAEFNLNILHHLNHRFNGNFDIDLFEHCAFYNRQQHRIEMHLRSLATQTIFLKELGYQFTINAGETIHTEISRKFHLPTLVDNLAEHAFKPLQIWTDPQDWFGLLLCQRQCTGDDCP